MMSKFQLLDMEDWAVVAPSGGYRAVFIHSLYGHGDVIDLMGEPDGIWTVKYTKWDLGESDGETAQATVAPNQFHVVGAYLTKDSQVLLNQCFDEASASVDGQALCKCY